MKVPTTCGPELLVNYAVLAGAWSFVLLLVVAIVNQWLTLNVVKDEINQQQKALQRDFAKVSADFVGIFNRLKSRISWHHFGLAVVLVIGLAGGGVATDFYFRVTDLAPVPCPTAAAKPNAVAANGDPASTPTTPPSGSTTAGPAAPAGGPVITPFGAGRGPAL